MAYFTTASVQSVQSGSSMHLENRIHPATKPAPCQNRGHFYLLRKEPHPPCPSLLPPWRLCHPLKFLHHRPILPGLAYSVPVESHSATAWCLISLARHPLCETHPCGCEGLQPAGFHFCVGLPQGRGFTASPSSLLLLMGTWAGSGVEPL